LTGKPIKDLKCKSDTIAKKAIASRNVILNLLSTESVIIRKYPTKRIKRIANEQLTNYVKAQQISL
ncbi:MAG: hypothetical protein DRR19_15060, partial [Candidatus Parabeggiatoa sp. nov. 1]